MDYEHSQDEVEAKHDQKVPALKNYVLVLPALGSKRCEHWLSLVKAQCSVPIDWHYIGGRNQIYTTGDPDIAMQAIRRQWLALYEHFRDQHLKDCGEEFYSHEWIRDYLGISTAAPSEAEQEGK